MPFDAIIVEVDEPKLTCLIDIPYTNQFEPVRNAISVAAMRLQLQPFEFAPGDVFTERIILETRSARLVVAVCTPDARGGVPNPNVMYELGLAQAIGKPILIMTTDASKLPADIRGITAMQYDARAVTQDAFAGTLKDKMEEVMGASRNGITDSRANVWVTGAKHQMLLTAKFWRSFGIVFTYANGVRNEMESVYRDHCEDIARHAKEILNSGEYDFDRVARAFWAVWGRHLVRYNGTSREILEVPGSFDQALSEMDKQTADDPDTKRQMQRIKDYSDILRSRMESFHESHQNAEKARQQFQQDKSNRQLRVRFNTSVRDLVGSVKELIDLSNGLVNNLVEMLAAGFEPTWPTSSAEPVPPPPIGKKAAA